MKNTTTVPASDGVWSSSPFFFTRCKSQASKFFTEIREWRDLIFFINNNVEE